MGRENSCLSRWRDRVKVMGKTGEVQARNTNVSHLHLAII